MHSIGVGFSRIVRQSKGGGGRGELGDMNGLLSGEETVNAHRQIQTLRQGTQEEQCSLGEIIETFTAFGGEHAAFHSAMRHVVEFIQFIRVHHLAVQCSALHSTAVG